MIEGLLAAQGDGSAQELGLSLVKSWLAMVSGPTQGVQPLAGGKDAMGSVNSSVWPYGISAVEWSHHNLGVAGVAAWSFPVGNEDTAQEHQGSAADADQDALLGMVYLAGALGNPADF